MSAFHKVNNIFTCFMKLLVQKKTSIYFQNIERHQQKMQL